MSNLQKTTTNTENTQTDDELIEKSKYDHVF